MHGADVVAEQGLTSVGDIGTNGVIERGLGLADQGLASVGHIGTDGVTDVVADQGLASCEDDQVGGESVVVGGGGEDPQSLPITSAHETVMVTSRDITANDCEQNNITE